MKKESLRIGDNEYTIELWKDKEIIGFDFKRNGIIQSSTCSPIKKLNSQKMMISEKLLQCAIYDINHFVDSIKLPTV